MKTLNTMWTTIIAAFATVFGYLVNHRLGKKKNQVEIEKMMAETVRTEMDTDRIFISNIKEILKTSQKRTEDLILEMKILQVKLAQVSKENESLKNEMIQLRRENQALKEQILKLENTLKTQNQTL